MRIGRFTTGGEPRIGVFSDGSVRDVTDAVGSFREVLRQVHAGEALPEGGDVIDADAIEYLPPTAPRSGVFAIALNYQSHIDEGYEETAPEWPLVFLKLYRSLIGHREPIPYRSETTDNLDYEAELAAVIGEPAWRVDAGEALDHVAGYTILNDVSARDLQFVQVGDAERLDWLSGKAMQGMTPMGPHLVTADEIADPQDLTIESRLNGEVMQDESTALMIRSVAEIIAFLSTRVRLEPGDVIATGTPEGVGLFQDVRLEDGDEIEITIDGIGTLANTVERAD